VTRTRKIAWILHGYLVALNKINTLVIYRNLDSIQRPKGFTDFEAGVS